MDNETDIEIVYLSDPDWDPALELLQQGDTSAIAALLKDERSMPAYIGRSIGIMLRPPEGYRGPTISVKVGKRTQDQSLQKIAEFRELRDQILAIQAGGKLEGAIAAVMKRTGLSRSHLMKALTFRDERRTVFECEKILGHVEPHSPQKLRKSRRQSTK